MPINEKTTDMPIGQDSCKKNEKLKEVNMKTMHLIVAMKKAHLLASKTFNLKTTTISTNKTISA